MEECKEDSSKDHPRVKKMKAQQLLMLNDLPACIIAM
ncbi:hypothetical protein B6N60_03769 [Richelia sinica FACHB-800]|uniref:Uncharacterized protein n=1 Tax=Richelia sinica FACHB-800 TaxID=1357546 RepID=A0A975TAJ7_9NOST|nr:hypothetical protein B6N60_03769 [Richelia sinica FACHB-800]